MSRDFILAGHPYPQIEGEMLLFQYQPDEIGDEENENRLNFKDEQFTYNDYSLKKRNNPLVKPKTIAVGQRKQLELADQRQTKL